MVDSTASSKSSSHTLRLSQFAEAQANTFRVELSFDGESPVRTHFQFQLSPQDQEDLRWYLEDYLEYPLDPAPRIAERIEGRMKEIGEDLFRKVFESGEPARRLWARLQNELQDSRIEILTEVREATSIPWELMRDPLTGTVVALRARSFVRAPVDPAQQASIPSLSEQDAKIRILLVICRPRGRDDVPFRSVASRIVRALSQDSRGIVQLDVLRPPTFEQLARVLREAKSEGQPYHIVHFDGHGVYAELIPPQQEEDKEAYSKVLQEVLKHLNATTLGTPRSGRHGYVLFENPETEQNMTLVDGPTLGKLLVETNVHVLVLNACQSAFAEAPTSPVAVSESSTQDQVRALGSFAQEVMDTGVAGVVAMRYVLYVETAKRFVTDLYTSLVRGDSLGEAVTYGRKQLSSNPKREIGYRPIDLQDWSVPIVYESAPIALFPRAGDAKGVMREIKLSIDSVALDGVPPPPDVGFYGRDETLLALDRAFDSQSIVLLHAYAGSGKTTTAAEFARWYALTGGIRGPILFTSFEQYKPLPRVLDTLERVFGKMLEQSGVNWLALDDKQRREVALQVMRQAPIFWIWDNVEPIAGFPAGTKSAWSEDEQEELFKFLNDARETHAKFLLTSRRDEMQWLGLLPRRITIPPMPMQESVQLARAIAEKFGRHITDVDDWRPLLEFTQGNPMTITVLVGQALRNGLQTNDQIQAFVERLRIGEAAFEDEVSEGRSKSLGASLGYGFENAFTEAERKQLALLHFFQGFVNVDALRQMGNLRMKSGEDFSVPELSGFTRESGVGLLDQAVEVGLLTAHGGGYYSIHPALPWYFKSLFRLYYPTERGQLSATRAFVEAIGELGVYCHRQYNEGNRDVVSWVAAEEANLLYALRLARRNSWWSVVIASMQGLRLLYEHTGRRAEWARLVSEIVPDIIDVQTGLPLAGREEHWLVVAQYRVFLAGEARQWLEAERLARADVEWTRERAVPALAIPPNDLNDSQRNAIRSLAASLHGLGEIESMLSQPDCVKSYEEAMKLGQRIDDQALQATIAFNLGDAYKNIPALRDLAQAEQLYWHGLDLTDQHDYLTRGRGFGKLGTVAIERYKEARDAKKPEAELFRYHNDGLQFCLQAIGLFPANAVHDLAVTHNQLGAIYFEAGYLDRSLRHAREAIRYLEIEGSIHHAGVVRRNVSRALVRADRLQDAREYALAALRNFETFGELAAEDIEQTKRLIAEIEEAMTKSINIIK